MDDIIRQHTPKDYRSEYFQTFLIFAIPSIVLMFLANTYMLPIAFIILGPILQFISDKIDPETFDGWLIDNDGITLSKTSRAGLVTKTLCFADIKQLKYFCGTRRSKPKLIFVTNENKIWLTLSYDSFKMASTLKYFQNKGLKVMLLQSDSELQMYLDGHIDKIPMTNKY